MSLTNPLWLALAGTLVPTLLIAWTLHDRRQRGALERLMAPHLVAPLTRSLCPRRRRLRRLLYAGALVLLCAALAGPRAGMRLVRIEQRGTDLLFAVDTSRSMLTADVRPDRLTRAKLAILDLLPQLDGDAVGLIAFAGSAFVQCPVTLDYGAFEESVEALDTHVIPHGGTDIASAIREATEAFRAHGNIDKVLVLITDGEDLEGSALRTAQAAAHEGVRIYTIGVGTASGDLIPLPPEQGGGFLKDSNGQLVKSRLDEPALEAIAQATGGRYVPLGAENQGLDLLYREVLAPRAHHDLESRTERIYLERFQWPLGASLVLLVASLLVSVRRPQPRIAPVAATASAVPARAVTSPLESAVVRSPALSEDARSRHGGHRLRSFLALAALAASTELLPSSPLAAAEAARVDPDAAYNDGTSAYRAGDYARAVEQFRASLGAHPSADPKRLARQEDTYYNLGNGLYRLGQKSESADPQRTIEHWQKALAAYDAALQLRPDDADGRFNRDFVRRRLESLKQAQNPGASGARSQSSPSAHGGTSAQSASSGQNNPASAQGNGATQSPESSAGAPAQANTSSPSDQRSADESNTSTSPSSAPSGAQQESSSPSSSAGSSASTGAPADGSQAPRQGRVASSLASQNGTAPQSGTESETRAQDARRMGGMSADEARELLDSVKSEERRLPSSARSGEAISSSDEPLRDW